MGNNSRYFVGVFNKTDISRVRFGYEMIIDNSALRASLAIYIEDITRWREDMNFIFEWQNNILRTSAASS